MLTYYNGPHWSRGAVDCLGWQRYNYVVLPLVWYSAIRQLGDKLANIDLIVGMSEA